MTRELLQKLDSLAATEQVKAAMEAAILRIESDLYNKPAELFGWQVLPLSLFPGLPVDVGSAWIFSIRAGLPPEKHRHPNSRQITMSFRGTGDLETWENGRWKSNRLTDDPHASVENRWVDIAPGVWHRPVVTANWVVLSFHTAAEDELIEESEEGQRTY